MKPNKLSENRRKEGYEDAEGYDWLAGNLITEATAAKKDRGVNITADERTTARKIYHRLAEMLRAAGNYSVNPEQPFSTVGINKKPGGAVEVTLSYDGMVGCSEDCAVRSVTHLLKGAALAMTEMGRPTRIAGDIYSLTFNNIQELASVVDVVTPDPEKKIGAPPVQRQR